MALDWKLIQNIKCILEKGILARYFINIFVAKGNMVRKVSVAVYKVLVVVRKVVVVLVE
jgi:hypothetical protein